MMCYHGAPFLEGNQLPKAQGAIGSQSQCHPPLSLMPHIIKETISST